MYSTSISFVLVFKFGMVNLFEQLFRVMQSRSEIMLRHIGPKNDKVKCSDSKTVFLHGD